MSKKCLICSADAQYAIKDTSHFYCAECGEEQFGDLALLVKLEQQKNPEPELPDEEF